MTDYQGEEESYPFEGLKTEEIADQDLDIFTDYCLECPCGKLLRMRQDRNGFVSFSDCPRAEKHNALRYNPQTGEHYQQRYWALPNLAVSCQITAVAKRENISVSLKDLLIIPKGWTLEVQDEEKEYDDYLNLDMEMTLHRIPDKTAYHKWEQRAEQARKAGYREEEIARLQQRLKELTGE